MESFSPRDILILLRRRKWHLLLPFTLLLSLTVLIAVSLPPVYLSTATILIEASDVPEELVRSPLASMADQRLQLIQQKVTAAPDLSEIIKQFGLYAKPGEKPSMAALVDRMRGAIKINQVTAEVTHRATGRPIQVTMGFLVSFEYGNPVIAQRVNNELVSRFLNENLKERRERSSQAIEFLSSELKRLEDTMREQEEKIAAFKARNAGSLPEDQLFTNQMIERNERELTELTRQIQLVEQRRAALRAQLAQLDPHAPVAATGRTAANPAAQLKFMEMEYVSLSARYGPAHPDVAKLKREMEALQAVLGSDGGGANERKLAELRAELVKAEKTLGPEHPDYLALQRQIAALESRKSSGRVAKARVEIDNPAYLQIKSQLDGVDAEYQTLVTQRETVRQQLTFYRDRATAIPAVELEYLALKRDYDNAASHYKDLKNKTMEAELGQAMERDRKAERFLLVEPPSMPAAPIKPKRTLIIGLGFMLGLGAGIGSVVAAEMLSQTIFGSRKIYDIAGELPLAIIPYIKNPREIARRRRKLIALGMLAALAPIVGLIMINQFVMPLDVLQFTIVRKLGLQ